MHGDIENARAHAANRQKIIRMRKAYRLLLNQHEWDEALCWVLKYKTSSDQFDRTVMKGSEGDAEMHTAMGTLKDSAENNRLKNNLILQVDDQENACRTMRN